MTSLVVNLKDAQEERILLAFLNSLDYSYATTEDTGSLLSYAQQKELLRREADFKSGKIKTEPWEKVRKRFIKE